MEGRFIGRRALWFIVADATALLAFVLVGLRGHRVGTIEGFVRNAVPILATWALVAWLVRTYRRPGWRSLLRTWIVAVPIGLVARTMIVGSPTGARILVFLGVGLAFTLLFLVLARVLLRPIARRR
jgi:hypothetical protein